MDGFLSVSYVGVGTLIGLFTLPIFSGNSKNPMMPDKGISYVLLFSFLWPIATIAIFWLFIQWYLCSWVHYLFRQSERKLQSLNDEFSSRWDSFSDEDKLRLNYNESLSRHKIEAEKIGESIGKYRHFLEMKARRGYWRL